ncbi:beta-1,4-xylanase [Nostoc sp. PCC 7524]|uniref:endo-1,4-beta-xylanase n=1 Tax=Nostoc sp. (strain ATCC 29411 / PCC 7524) TaxID=28072 RepID=UPI00029EF136|nr:endo-1,4-beta-xylanase [Nostoc sp. PCC 7524]AFY46257.1 beta-1,4-xylanase [Nostoc sp. PCC 7524]
MYKRLMSRRRTLWLGLGTLASIGALFKNQVMSWNNQTQAIETANRDFKVVGGASLKQRAAAKGLIYGVAIRYHNLFSNQKLAAVIAQECGMIVPEWELKWHVGNKPLRPTPDTFDFSAADRMVKFSRTHKMQVRGHTLVWHESLPPWFGETVNRQNAEQFLTKHIQTVVRHYAGQMHSWDVVNEAIEIDDGKPRGLRNTPWWQLLGENYIDLAFRVAAEADPKALLVYNDYGLDYDTPEDEAKRTAVLKLLERLKSQGTPIHALGTQAHLSGGDNRFHPRKLRKFLSDVADMGLKILITEMDVKDRTLPVNIQERDRIIAAAYEDFLSTVLDEPAVIAVLTWGLSDRYTWLSEFRPRPDRLPVRPLPFDADMNRKLAWNAIARAFDQAPKR